MKARIYTVGDELLTGQTLDTNSFFIAGKLTAMGFNIEKACKIADNVDEILFELQDTVNSGVALAIFTGGLGPTSDDKTRKVFEKFFNSRMVQSPEVLENIKNLLKQRNLRLNRLNEQQALVPHNAKIIKNSIGTAPGIWLEKEQTVFVFLPGVPFEMEKIFSEELEKLLRQRFSLSGTEQRIIHTFGLIEADLAEKLQPIENQLPEYIKIAYLPSPEDIKIKLWATETKAGLDTEMDFFVAGIKKIIGDYIFGFGEITLQEALKDIFTEKGLTVSTAESCTGGNIAHKITTVPGSSAYFKGSVVAYSNEVKINILGVPEKIIEKFGAVSEQTVIRMAEGVRKLMKTDFSVATSGIAGPSGGTPEKPVGTVWIAVSTPNETFAKLYRFGNLRSRNIRKSTAAAIFNLIKAAQKF